MPELRAVITDWGGVLTQPIKEMVRDWVTADEIDWDTYVAVVGPWLTGVLDPLPTGIASGAAADAATDADIVIRNGHMPNPVHALERGECTVADFEQLLAGRLLTTSGGVVKPEGLLRRMLAGTQPVPAMYDLLRDLRRRGVRTALLSNSWGDGGYPRQDFPELFDAVVISGEVGMRKPESRIFLHTAGLLDVNPAECVFIDDLISNVEAAIGCGMTGVHHTDPADTLARLTHLFAAG